MKTTPDNRTKKKFLYFNKAILPELTQFIQDRVADFTTCNVHQLYRGLLDSIREADTTFIPRGNY